MHRSLRNGLWLALPLSMGIGSAGWGQAVSSGNPTATATSTTPASATDTANQLQDVLVTAQRRTERAQDVPIAVSVITGEELQSSGFHDLTDLEYIDPAVTYDPNSGGSFQIRGVGTQSWDYATEQSVSVVVDDVVQDLPREPGLTSLTDIDHIEVLRGPQGVQFGRNATAGVISVTTNRPELGELSGDADAEYGERDDEKFNGTINAPIGDMAALRVGGYYQKQNGLGEYTVLEKNLGEFEEYGTRAKLLLQPSEDLSVLLTGDLNLHHDNNCYPLLALNTPLGPLVGPHVAAAGVAVGPDNLDSASPDECILDYETQGLSLLGNVHLSGLTLTSITAYEDLTYTQKSPIVSDPVTDIFAPVNNSFNDAHKVSEELRLTSPAAGPVSYVVGLYFNRLITESLSEQALAIPGVPLPPGVLAAASSPAGTPSAGYEVFNVVSQSEALFGVTTIKPVELFDLVLGGRLTHDFNSQGVGFETISAPYEALGTGVIVGPPYGSEAATNFSYRVAPTFHVTRDAIGYVSYSTGYKPPGVAYVGGAYSPYRRETVGDFEVGLKSDWFDHQLRFNADYFYETFKDFQAQEQSVVDGQPVLSVLNAGGLRSQGVETDLEWRADRRLTLHASATYADAIFTDFLYNPGPPTPPVQLAGQPLTHAPKWSTTVGAMYSRLLAENLQLDVSADYNWRSSQYLHLDDPESLEGSYGLLQARIGVGPPDGQWRVGAYGRNLTNSYYIDQSSLIFPFYRIGQTDTNAGRTLGGFVSARF